jgi:hypothetical protein
MAAVLAPTSAAATSATRTVLLVRPTRGEILVQSSHHRRKLQNLINDGSIDQGFAGNRRKPQERETSPHPRPLTDSPNI